jgi:hypothetical protein
METMSKSEMGGLVQMSRRRRITLLLPMLVLLVSTSWSVAQPIVTVSAILQHPDQYDGKVVSVAGTITTYREHVSAKGNPYTTFRLEDGGSISVFAWKHQGLKNGLRVRATGTFAATKRVGQYIFHNEIEAQQIRVLK